ncbi:uracil-DNA glycosylase [Gracilinema caldarium]|uniref:Type-4 uracil-DNA glycosylase n=1 Tax=Gracilinema caldarium (strain ATCC 51460 / DSM 7334 / H1) TaxID=744872 RepID=F8EZA5_GRAC1|nr:uracil-DNA glycosylase [Gracilinema caldarium]AEJ19697.1 phage SPO1 DNA polymerase-related protein [Gracilinema caldarium DSM 7334]
MTADEKRQLLTFLDLASDYLDTGYRREREAYHIDDDRPLAPAAEADSLAAIAEEVRACRACRLCEGRHHAVPGEGVAEPLVVVIGEGPGADEDSTGRPFVGRAGQLLDKMLAAINLDRNTNCFIANVVKCRPPNNRDPESDEIAACGPFLQRQLALLKPQAILTVGRVPTQALLGTAEGISRLRGRFFEYQGIPLLPTYHPSALLRDESLKRPAWEDLKQLRAFLNGGTAARETPERKPE